MKNPIDILFQFVGLLPPLLENFDHGVIWSPFINDAQGLDMACRVKDIFQDIHGSHSVTILYSGIGSESLAKIIKDKLIKISNEMLTNGCKVLFEDIGPYNEFDYNGKEADIIINVTCDEPFIQTMARARRLIILLTYDNSGMISRHYWNEDSKILQKLNDAVELNLLKKISDLPSDSKHEETSTSNTPLKDRPKSKDPNSIQYRKFAEFTTTIFGMLKNEEGNLDCQNLFYPRTPSSSPQMMNEYREFSKRMKDFATKYQNYKFESGFTFEMFQDFLKTSIYAFGIGDSFSKQDSEPNIKDIQLVSGIFENLFSAIDHVISSNDDNELYAGKPTSQFMEKDEDKLGAKTFIGIIQENLANDDPEMEFTMELLKNQNSKDPMNVWVIWAKSLDKIQDNIRDLSKQIHESNMTKSDENSKHLLSKKYKKYIKAFEGVHTIGLEAFKAKGRTFYPELNLELIDTELSWSMRMVVECGRTLASVCHPEFEPFRRLYSIIDVEEIMDNPEMDFLMEMLKNVSSDEEAPDKIFETG